MPVSQSERVKREDYQRLWTVFFGFTVIVLPSWTDEWNHKTASNINDQQRREMRDNQWISCRRKFRVYLKCCLAVRWHTHLTHIDQHERQTSWCVYKRWMTIKRYKYFKNKRHKYKMSEINVYSYKLNQ